MRRSYGDPGEGDQGNYQAQVGRMSLITEEAVQREGLATKDV